MIRQTIHDSVQTATMPTHDHRLHSLAAKAGRFLWHLLQMVLAMEAGMMVYHLLLRPLLAPTGYAVLTKAYPLLGYWMMVVSMALGMIALMRYHRSTWRYCLEMTLAMLAPLVGLTALVQTHMLPTQTLYGVGDPAMVLAMAAYMLYRPHEHAHGAHGNAGHHQTGLPQVEAAVHTTHESHEAHQREA
jgi:hypothetical protein